MNTISNRWLKLREIHCLVCNKVDILLKPHNAKTCSDACSVEYKRELWRKKSQIRRHDPVQKVLRRQEEKKLKVKRHIFQKCQWCKNIILYDFQKDKRDRYKFCSDKCKYKKNYTKNRKKIIKSRLRKYYQNKKNNGKSNRHTK